MLTNLYSTSTDIRVVGIIYVQRILWTTFFKTYKIQNNGKTSLLYATDANYSYDTNKHISKQVEMYQNVNFQRRI